LKLVTGVDISTRPVRRSGRLGKVVKSRIRTAAAAPNRAAFRLSRDMLDHSKSPPNLVNNISPLTIVVNVAVNDKEI